MAIKDTDSLDELIQMVSFNLDDEIFGIDILAVQEINRMVEITKVPQAPHYCEGVINLRGKVIPVIDLRKKFDMVNREWDRDTRIIVCDISNQQIGMIVDSVDEVLRIPNTSMEPAPGLVTSIGIDYIKGVAKIDQQLLIFLDITRIASEVNQAVAGAEAPVA